MNLMNETTFTSAPTAPVRRLERDPNGSIAGVASGLAHYFGVDVSLMRLLMVAATITAGFGPIFYLLAWIIMPEASAPLHPPTGPVQSGPVSGSAAVS